MCLLGIWLGKIHSPRPLQSPKAKKQSNFYFPRKQSMVYLDKDCNGKCKAKAIQADLGIFRHNQTHPAIIQPY